MVTLDANILIYAHNEDAPEFRKANRWFSAALSDNEVIGLSWLVILAFLRISTSKRLFSTPLTIGEAQRAIDGFLASPNVEVINATDNHWTVLKTLIKEGQVKGPLVMDAHLAALCIEHNATLATNDCDFARFPGLRTINPLTA
jgi:toxin-antitoxin system PIN domain toxin